jgi:glucan biosynthesis protein C
MIEGRTPAHRHQPREHHWDTLRALLMLLGIPYHVAMAYRQDMPWIVTSGERAMAFNWIAQTIHTFRMPAFFFIAGYFAMLLLARRSPRHWLQSRFARLGVPFIAALLTLNPLLNLICELSNFGWPDALASWDHNSATSGGYWIRHLWFLIVLLYLSSAAALVCRLFPSLHSAALAPRTDQWLARHIVPVVIATAVLLGIWQGVMIELFYIGGFATNGYQQILRLDQLIEFAPWFLLGCVVARAPALKNATYRLSPTLILFALTTLALDLALREQLWPPYGRFLDTLAAVSLTQLLIATIKRIADRPSRTVTALVDASFVIYLFHLPILAALVVFAGPHLAIPLGFKALLFMGLTFALSWCCWLIVKRWPLLRLLYDGMRLPAAPQPATAPTTAAKPAFQE